MRKQLTSLLLLLTVLTSAYVYLNSANPLSTVTTTFTSTYTMALTKSTTVSTIYATYVLTSNMPIGSDYDDLRLDDGRTRVRVWFHLKAGDIITIKAETPRDNSWADVGYSDVWPAWNGVTFLTHLSFGSGQYDEKTYQAIKEGYYLVEFTMSGQHSSLPVSITAHGTAEHTVTSSNYMVEQYVTTVLTEDVLTETRTVTGWYESPFIIIAVIVVVAVAIVFGLMKRKSKPKQTPRRRF